MTLSIEPVDAEDRDTFSALVAHLVRMEEEGMALAPVSPEKVAEKIYHATSAGMAWVAKRDGEIVGSIGLKEIGIDYAEDGQTFLNDSWLYVADGERMGDIGVKLIRLYREYAEKAGKPALLSVMNPSRRKKKTTTGLYMEIGGFLPLGHVTRIN